jgi:hypothetical protein
MTRRLQLKRISSRRCSIAAICIWNHRRRKRWRISTGLRIRPMCPASGTIAAPRCARLHRLDEALVSYERAVGAGAQPCQRPDQPRHLPVRPGRWIRPAPPPRPRWRSSPISPKACMSSAISCATSGVRHRPGLFRARAAGRPHHRLALNGLAQHARRLCDWDRMAALTPRLRSDIAAAVR